MKTRLTSVGRTGYFLVRDGAIFLKSEALNMYRARRAADTEALNSHNRRPSMSRRRMGSLGAKMGFLASSLPSGSPRLDWTKEVAEAMLSGMVSRSATGESVAKVQVRARAFDRQHETARYSTCHLIHEVIDCHLGTS